VVEGALTAETLMAAIRAAMFPVSQSCENLGLPFRIARDQVCEGRIMQLLQFGDSRFVRLEQAEQNSGLELLHA
jgi:hypothetical protein